jgi:hypothetical protein
VSLERLNGLFVDLPQFAIFESEPDAEVNHSVEVKTDDDLVVPGPHESLLVLVDQVPEVRRPDGRPSANGVAGAIHRFFSLGASLPGGGNYLKYSSGLEHARRPELNPRRPLRLPPPMVSG